MKDKPTPEQIAKLPQWAQEHIKYLNMERDTAIRALNEHIDHQTPSPLYWDQYLSTGEGNSGGLTGPTNKRFYVQNNRMTFEHAGVLLQVTCHNGDSMHERAIDLQWSVPTGTIDMVAFVPRSFQQALLISHDNMRVQKLRKKPPNRVNYDEETLDFVRHGLSCYDCGLLAETEEEHYARLFEFLELDTWLRDKVVVDVGCGVGALLEALKRRYPASQGFGVTNCPVQLHLTWDKSVSAYYADMDQLDFLPADLFIFTQSIGHAKSMPAVVAECAAKLRPGGRLFIKDFDCVEVSARNAWGYRMEPAANFVQAATQAGLRLLKQEIPKVSYERYMRYWRESAYMLQRYGPAPDYMIANSLMLLFEK